jgi:hypothetical protein
MAIGTSSDRVGGRPGARLRAAVNDPLAAEVGVSLPAAVALSFPATWQ